MPLVPQDHGAPTPSWQRAVDAKFTGNVVAFPRVVGAGMRDHSVVAHRVVGVVLGTSVFLLLPAFIIGSAIDCTSANPSLHCALVQLVFDDGQSGRIPIGSAKSE